MTVLIEQSRFVTELDAFIATLIDLSDDADCCGEEAVSEKINEALGPLRSAREAARQYDAGILPLPEVNALDVACEVCTAAEGIACTRGPRDPLTFTAHPERAIAAHQRITEQIDAKVAALGSTD